MKILIVEDDSERIKGFQEKLEGNTLVIAATAADAINALKAMEFHGIFLDHDLGEGNGSGEDVARWIMENMPNTSAVIYVHSMNPVGARNIKGKLPQAHLVPGCWK